METLKFNIDLEPVFHKTPPKIKICVNDQELFNGDVDTEMKIEKSLELSDDSKHQLTIDLYGKTDEDTVVDADGNILKDQLIKIKDIMIDDVSIVTILSLDQENFYYEHDGNGSHDLRKGPFFDTFGCNGTGVINFTTPFYVWLLETL